MAHKSKSSEIISYIKDIGNIETWKLKYFSEYNYFKSAHPKKHTSKNTARKSKCSRVKKD